MRRYLSVLAAAAALAVCPLGAGPALADACDGPYTSVGGVLYVDVRGDAADGSIWVFIEDNGSAGLQRGGEHIAGLYSDDDCAVPGVLGDSVIY